MSNFVKTLKVGDKVILTYRSTKHIREVVRLTSKQVVLNGGERFLKENGRHVGGGIWDQTDILEYTEELARKTNRQNYTNAIRFLIREGSDLSKLEDKELITIYNILKPYKKVEK